MLYLALLQNMPSFLLLYDNQSTCMITPHGKVLIFKNCFKQVSFQHLTHLKRNKFVKFRGEKETIKCQKTWVKLSIILEQKSIIKQNTKMRKLISITFNNTKYVPPLFILFNFTIGLYNSWEKFLNELAQKNFLTETFSQHPKSFSLTKNTGILSWG